MRVRDENLRKIIFFLRKFLCVGYDMCGALISWEKYPGITFPNKLYFELRI